MNEKRTLTESQAAIVNAESKQIAVLAGPGAGKTHTMLARYMAMVTTEAWLITFTNAGAEELRARIKAKGLPQPDYVGTLHGLMLRLLKVERPHLTILDEKQADELAKECLAEIRSKVTSKALRTSLSAERVTQAENVAVMHYRAKLREYGAEDYDTLLVAGLDLLRKTPHAVRLLMVDEYQDSGRLDHQIYAAINAAYRFYVGDTDQAIYSFRGGRLENLMEYAEAPGTWCAFLEDNFRSGSAITEAASRMIRHNRCRIEKATKSVTGFQGTVGVRVLESEAEEMAAVVEAARSAWDQGRAEQEDGAEGSAAVLCRYNTGRTAVADALRAAGVPVSEPERVDRPADWPTALALLAVAANPENPLAVRRYLSLTIGKAKALVYMAECARKREKPAHAVSPYLLSAMEEAKLSHASRMELVELWGDVAFDSFRNWWERAAEMLLYAMQTETAARRNNTPGVEVLTMHGSKGREFDRVILPAWDEGPTGSFPGREVEEDRRLAFVSVTRARFEVLVTASLKRMNPYGRKEIEDRKPSRFINELLK